MSIMIAGKERQVLSELEGAILLEVHMRGRNTAFQVRSAFLTSPTSDWSGSAGAVYPAIKRLEENGYISRTAKIDGRGTQTLSATPDGITALNKWALAPDLSAVITADPFRTRSDYLRTLPPEQRSDALDAIKAALIGALAEIDELVDDDHVLKQSANQLAGQLLRTRLAWLEQIRKDG